MITKLGSPSGEAPARIEGDLLYSLEDNHLTIDKQGSFILEWCSPTDLVKTPAKWAVFTLPAGSVEEWLAANFASIGDHEVRSDEVHVFDAIPRGRVSGMTAFGFDIRGRFAVPADVLAASNLV
jgi:hypothetical protein